MLRTERRRDAEFAINLSKPRQWYGGLSDFAERELLDLMFSNASYTPGATMYMSLHTASPADTGANEMTLNNYARKSVPNNATVWPAATGIAGTKQNAAAITFTTATAAWGTASHFAFWDAATAGNMLVWGTLTTGKSIGANDVAKFNASAVTITFG